MIRLAAATVLLAAVALGIAQGLPTPDLMDFGSFVASGRAAGDGLDPYGIHPLTFHVVLPGFEAWNPNLNPPTSLLLFERLGRLDPHEAFRLWWAVSAMCYGAAVLLLARRYGGGLTALWAVALAGVWDTLALGQIYLPLVLATVGGWLALERGHWLRAGVLIGVVVAMKPNFAVWPALLLLAGQPRPVAVAAVTAAVLAAVPTLLYGPPVWAQWAHLVAGDGGRAVFLTNASLSGLAQRLGLPLLGTLASLGLLAGLAWRAWRWKPSPLEASALGLAAAVLASPIAWVHYTLFLLPVFFARPPTRAMVAAAALLVVPVPLIIRLLEAPWWVQASLGSVYGWAMVLVLAALLPAHHRMKVVPQPR